MLCDCAVEQKRMTAAAATAYLKAAGCWLYDCAMFDSAFQLQVCYDHCCQWRSAAADANAAAATMDSTVGDSHCLQLLLLSLAWSSQLQHELHVHVCVMTSMLL